ncbi:MAG: hypothetical protein ABL901_10145 [Hyphomicrobiaceae bacterium]
MTPRIEALLPLFERLDSQIFQAANTSVGAASFARKGEIETALDRLPHLRWRIDEALLLIGAIETVRVLITNESNAHE